MQYIVLKTEAEVRELIAWHNENSEYVVFDLETTGLDRFKDRIVDAQISGRDPETVAIFSDLYLGALAGLHTVAVGHNLKFDIAMLHQRGIDVTHWEYRDTQILGHLLDENRDSHSLDSYVKEYWNDDYKEQFWARYSSYDSAPEDERFAYGAKDIYYTGKLYRHLSEALVADGIPASLVEHVHRLQYSLLKTEIAGIAVDEPYLLELGVKIRSQIESLLPLMRKSAELEIELVELEIWRKEMDKRKTDKGKAGVPRPQFSFDSSKQLQSLLYDVMGLPKQYNEKTKKVSVDDASLDKLKELHPVVAQLRQYREAQKIYGTYVEGVLERMVEGRIYPSFNVTGTVTGRISHSNPNLGNMPAGGGIRGMFVPDPGHVLISADFSQLEVCVSAHFTRDPNLLRIINEGASQHDITAAGLGIPRALAKTLNFGMAYGCSHFKVAKVLGVSPEKGKVAYDKYWETYSGQKRVMDECAAKVDRGEPIVNPFGRRRRFEKRERESWDSAYRQAWNALVQGTGSDCTSRAFYLADESLRRLGIGKALFTVHDEILIQSRAEQAAEAEKILVEAMVAVGQEIGLTVPLRAESSGPTSRWED